MTGGGGAIPGAGGDPTRATPAPSGPVPRLRPPNVLIVVMDCARAKSFVPSAGARTPEIDRLARRGTRFPRAVAPANWTIPSHMSIFTGTYPNVHGLRTFHRGTVPRATLAAELGRRGYETALFTEMVHLVAGYGLEGGFDRTEARHHGLADEDRTSANRLAATTDVLYAPWVRHLIERLPPFVVPLNVFNHPQEVAFKRQVCGRYVVDAFDRWLTTRSPDRPFHAFFNIVDTHEPYAIVPNGHRVGPLARWYARTPRYYLLAVPGLQALVPWPELVAGYHRSIEAADAKVGEILRALERAGEADRTLVIITSDHGQSFGEGGNVFHGCGATDSITRVPLVVAGPAGSSLPPQVERWTSLCEIAGWVRAAAAGAVPFDDDGRAPLPFSLGVPSPDTVFCEGAPASDPNRSLTGIRPDAAWNHRLLAAYRADGKYVVDLASGDVLRWAAGPDDYDTAEPERLAGPSAADVRATVFGEYEAEEHRRAARAAPPALSPELDRRLRSWGYD